MSTVIIQVGQCGNQVGEQLLETMYRESERSQLAKHYTQQFFTTNSDGTKVANAVLVDMEAKVVSKCLHSQKEWSYNPLASVTSKQGSGNNWANGYYNSSRMLEERLREAIRVVSSQLPHINTVLVLMSCAGGTGSGLGCKLTELVKDILPGALVINQVILPFSQGEVSVQGYNTILTLSALYQHSDSIILTHNDHYQTLSKRLTLTRSTKNKISFDAINKLISCHLAGILLPSYTVVDTVTEDIGRLRLDDVIEHLVPHPGYKFLSQRMMPVVSDYSREFTNTTWAMLAKYSRQMVLQDSVLDEGLLWSIKPRSELSTCNKNVSINTCISNFIVCRGTKLVVQEVEEWFGVKDMYSRNRPRCLVSYAAPKFDNLDKTVFVMSNAARNAAFLEDVLTNSWTKFQAKAFLYQYENFGLTKDEFLNSFHIIEKVNNDYKALL